MQCNVITIKYTLAFIYSYITLSVVSFLQCKLILHQKVNITFTFMYMIFISLSDTLYTWMNKI